MATPRQIALLAAALAAALLAAACARPPLGPPDDRDWRVFAVEYGRSTAKRSMLVRGGDAAVRAPMSWCAWLLVSRESIGRRVLVDTGFADPAKEKGWRFERRERVSALLERAGVGPASITDVVLTHGHFDHAGDLAPYTNARVWIQRAALAAIRGGLRAPGAITALDGPKEIAPGVTLVPGGGHAPGLQWVRIALGDARRRTAALASDIAYLAESLERRVPTGSTPDPAADLAAMDAILAATGGTATVLAGHDPAVARLPQVAEHVHELR